MPTAAKLVAAAMFALVGLVGALYYSPLLPEGTQVRWLPHSAAIIGFLCGWMIMGRQAGRGVRTAIGNGISTVVALVFWLALGWSIYEMVVRSTKMMYDGPMEAVLAVFDLMVGYGRLMLAPEIIGTVVIGGVLGGIATELAGRRWS